MSPLEIFTKIENGKKGKKLIVRGSHFAWRKFVFHSEYSRQINDFRLSDLINESVQWADRSALFA